MLMAVVDKEGQYGSEIRRNEENRPNKSNAEELRFDYSSVSPSVSRFLQGQADRIRRQSSASIVQIGKALVNAKHYLSHGAFIVWVENEACIPARTAQVYMRVAQWVTDKSAAAAYLPPSVLQLLSAPSTPKEFIDDVLTRLNSGERIVPSAVRKELKALRQIRRDALTRGASGSELPANVPKADTDVTYVDTAAVVRRAIAIIAKGLSTRDFERVRAMLTSEQVLHAPQLADTIAASFTDVAGLTQIKIKGQDDADIAA